MNKNITLSVLCGSTALLGTMAQASTDYGPAVWRPVCSGKWYTSGYGKRFYVIHDMEGYYLSSISYMQRCDISVSVHYAVNGVTDYAGDAAPGEVSQLVRDAYYAWHACCWNKYSMGTEHEGFASNPAWYTEAMYQSSSLLVRSKCDKYGIAKDHNHVIAHGQKLVSGWVSWMSSQGYSTTFSECNNHTDPGPYWDWTHFMNLIVGGTDGATYVSQSVANNTVFSPGQGFSCTFTMHNSGSTTWIANGGNGYTLNIYAGEAMGAPTINGLGGNVGPGGNGSFTLNFVAPSASGSHTANLQMNNSAGAYFGVQFAFTIQVGQVNNASVVGISAPGQVTVGSPFTATVTMNNNGTKPWATSTSHSLGSQSPQDNGTWGFGRVALPFTPVNPGQNATFTLNCTAPTTAGNYAFAWKMVQDGVEWFGGTASTTINVVVSPPTITTQPSNQSVNAGANATFTVVASGATSYQWQKDGVNISGATSSGYTRSNVQVADTGFYRCIVSNAGGSVTSSSAQLILNGTPTAPATGTGLQAAYYDNIDFTALTLSRVDPTVNFAWGLGSPDPSIGADQFSVRWSGQVQPRYSQTITFYTATDDGARLWVNGVLLIDKWVDQGGTEWSGSIALTAGQNYNIQYDYYENGGGAGATLSWSSPSQVKEIIPSTQLFASVPPTITTQPQGQTASPSANATFSVVAGGTAPLTYQWRLNQVNISGATGSSYTRNNVQSADVGYYSVVVGNAVGSVTSSEAALALNTGIIFNETFESGNLNNWGIATGSSALAISTAQHSSGSYSAQVTTSANKMFHNLGAEIDGHARVTFWIYDDSGTQTRCFGDVRGYTGAGYADGGVAQTFAIGRYSVGFGTGTGNLAGEVVNTANYQGRVLSGANTGWFNLNTARATGWHKFEIERLSDGSTINFFADGVLSRQITGATSTTWDDVTIGSIGSGTTGGNGWFDDVKVEYYDLASITTQPANQTVGTGSTATFTVATSGNVTGYQWRKNGVNISGATSAALTLGNVQMSDAADYSVIVINALGVVASSSATLTVNAVATPPTITTQPQSQTAIMGDTVTMTVAATGSDPLSYQWRKNGADIVGETQSIYAQQNVQAADAGSYTVVVSNSAGSATSSAATLTVNIPPSITAQPASQAVSPGANVNFSVIATGTAPLSYQWRFNGNNIAGETASVYTRVNVSSGDAGNYSVAISNVAGSITSADAVLTVNTPPSITTQPAGQIVAPGANVTFSVTASGTAPLTYQWKLNQVDISGATASSYTRNNVQSADVGNYSVVVGNVVGSVTSTDAALSLNDVVVFNETFESGNLNNWTVVTAATTLDISTAQNHTSPGSYSAYVNNSKDKMYHNLGVSVGGRVKATFWMYDNMGGQTRWFSEVRGYSGGGYGSGSLLQLFAIGRYSVGFGTGTGTLAGEVVNTAVYQGRVSNGSNTGWLNLNGAGTPARSAGWHRFEIERLADGTTVNFSVDGVLSRTVTAASNATLDSAAIGSLGSSTVVGDAWIDDVKVEYFDLPSIATQPANQTVSAGSTVTFTVAASGTVQSYQWRKNGVNIAGATASSYVKSNVQAGDIGTYTAVVANGAGPVTSASATLTVNAAAPSIVTQPQSQNVNAGSDVTFNVGAVGTDPLSYQWRLNAVNISGATASSYTRINVQSGDTGSYSVVVNNSSGSATSANAVLGLNAPPAITTQPQNQTVNPGGSATFSVVATGTSLSYQWRQNGADIVDATASSYTLTNAQPVDAGDYTVLVSNPAGSVLSAAALLTVNSPAFVTTQPQSQAVSPGANVTFTVGASGTSPFTYQWRLNAVNISGATASSYTRNNVQSGDAGNYSVVVSNVAGSDTSADAVLTLNIPPSITSQPANQTVNAGANATFSVSASGTAPLTYQWRFDSDNIPGATDSSYTRSNAQSADAGVYSAVVMNAFGVATSLGATLTVHSPPAITTQPSGLMVNQGSSAAFSVVVSGDSPLSYQWRFNAGNISGATDSSYTKSNAQPSDAGNYSVVITNLYGTVTSSDAALVVNTPPSITTQPVSQTVAPGANVTFSVTATGTAPLGYQWRLNQSDIAGATTSSYTRNNVQSADVGNYSVTVNNSLGTAISADASLTINDVIVFNETFESGNVNNWTIVSAASTLDISTSQNHTTAGAYSAYINSTLDKMYHNVGEIEGRCRATFWIYDSTQTRAFGETRGYTGAGYANGGLQQLFAIGRYGVGFGTGTGTLASEVVNTGLYQGRVSSGSNTGWFNLTGAAGRTTGWHKFEIDRLADGTTINFSVDGVLGRQIPSASNPTLDCVAMGSIATGSTAGDAWFDDIKMEYYDPPTITTQPASQTIVAGSPVTFSVVANGNVSSYQWRKNGVNIAGATGSSYTITSVSAGDAGSYTVVVSSGAGPVTSSAATLTVN